MGEMICTHKVYGFVTEAEFYAGINEAKQENLFVDEKGKVDIGKLIRLMWVAFGEGRMAIVPKEGFHRPEKKIESSLDDNPDAASLDLIGVIEKKPAKKRTTKKPVIEEAIE